MMRETRVALAMNHSFTEGLRCGWRLQCPFNTTVEVHFTEVNIGYHDTLRVFDGWDVTFGLQLAYYEKVRAFLLAVASPCCLPLLPWLAPQELSAHSRILICAHHRE